MACVTTAAAARPPLGMPVAAEDGIDEDLPYLLEGESGIALPVHAGDAQTVEPQLRLQRAADRLQDAVELTRSGLMIWLQSWAM
jgi:hypothetical protein